MQHGSAVATQQQKCDEVPTGSKSTYEIIYVKPQYNIDALNFDWWIFDLVGLAGDHSKKKIRKERSDAQSRGQ